jgi:hypothetical protein
MSRARKSLLEELQAVQVSKVPGFTATKPIKSMADSCDIIVGLCGIACSYYSQAHVFCELSEASFTPVKLD